MANLPTPEILPTASFTLSGTVEMNAGGNPLVLNAVRIGLHGALGPGQEWFLYRNLTNVGTEMSPDWRSQLFLRSPLLTGDVELQQLVLGATIPGNVYFTPVSFTSTLGPFRLGVAMGASGVAYVTGTPLDLAEYRGLHYTRYEDEATHYNETFATQAADIFPVVGVQALSGDVAQLLIYAQGAIDTAGEEIAHFTAVTVNGTLLPVSGLTLHNAHWQEVAAGAFNAIGTVADQSNQQFTAAPGGTVSYDMVVRDYAGTVIAAAEVVDDWLTTVDLHAAVQKTPFAATVPLTPTSYVIPVQTSYSRPTRDLPDGLATGGSLKHSVLLSMRAAWMTSAGWDPLDLPVVLDQASPLTGAATYSPLVLFHRERIEVDRPDGGRPSSWSINSGANGSVVESATDTVFTVTNVAAVFTRTLKENWRNQITPGDPNFQIDRYSILKHHFLQDAGETQTVYPEDIWWWNSHEFLRLVISASAPATLTLRVDGIDLEVFDGHNPVQAIRLGELGFLRHDERRIYTAALASGANTVWIDLSFPVSYTSESGAEMPMRRPRVDTLMLTFSATGTFTVTAMELSRRDSYVNETKVAYSPISTYPAEWPGMYTRVDGTPTVALTVPDATKKGMEREGNMGGAIRFAEPSTVAVLSAYQMVEDYQRVEGFSFTENVAARTAFHRDAAGTDLVTRDSEPAQFITETTPGGAWSGAGDAHAFTPALAIRVGEVIFPNGMTVTFKGRKRLGGGVESVVCTGGLRAGAAINVEVRDQVNTLLGTVASDARGRVHFEPIGHGKTVRLEAA